MGIGDISILVLGTRGRIISENQGPKDLGAHWPCFFFFASQHAFPNPSSDDLISSIFASASLQGGKKYTC